MDYRPATADDVDAIRSIARESWETDYPDIVSRETIDEGFEEWYASEELERELREGDAIVMLADSGDDPVGFAHGIVSEGVGNILRLYVRPGARRQGTGSELLERTADRLAEAGADRLRAMVLEDNDTGRSFYRAAGFDPASSARTNIGSETHEELTLVRPIRASAGST